MTNGQELRAILGKGIRFYRQQRQLSQAALAEKADISITYLSNISVVVNYRLARWNLPRKQRKIIVHTHTPHFWEIDDIVDVTSFPQVSA